jgi:signal transduction histidine kinase
MSLQSVLRLEREGVLEEFAERVRTMYGDREPSVLINGLPAFFDRLLLDLTDSPPPEDPVITATEPASVAAEHGAHRVALGADVITVAREWEVLRDVLIERLIRHDATVTMHDYRVLVRQISRAALASLQRFVEASERERRLQSVRHTSMLAHDIRNQLVAAMAALDLLESGGDRDAAKRWLADGLRAIREVLDRELTVARLDTLGTDGDLVLQPVVLGDLIRVVSRDVAPLAASREVEISTAVDGVVVVGDRRLLHSALVNVLGNAVKFTGHGTRVSISAVRDGADAAVVVEDRCGGLAPGTADRLFTAHAPGKHYAAGFGLGLAIVKQVVDRHRGSIAVDDLPGRGCRFTVRLRLADDHASATPARRPPVG